MIGQDLKRDTFLQRHSYAIKSAGGVLGIVIAVVTVITIMSAMKPKPTPKEEEKAIIPKVKTITVSPETMNISVSSQGSVTPVRQINLVSEVSGRVVSVADAYAPGGFFTKDQAIVTIDSRDYEFALHQAESDLAKAKELHAMEKGRARQARGEWRDVGNKEANDLFLRKPQLASAKAAVDAAEANRDRARLNIARTRISAPFNGRINTKGVDVGQYVAQGTVIAEVYSTEAVQVRLPLTDKQVAKVNLPLTASNSEQTQPEVILTTVYGGKKYSWQGKIVRTEGSFDVRSRTIFAVAEVRNPFEHNPNEFKPPLSVGMYVSAEIIGHQLENVVTLPRKVLHKKNQVIVVGSDNRISFKTVDLLQSEGDNVLVGGLENGEKVMSTRVPYAVADLEVEPANDDAEEAIAKANEG
ncbi:efflux RND transporter periplasmic adaptor subunit [Agarilytica rhodophyticola]|uniref:efflux RND transporter periplasmic adaptor subunit n=1 Tax=Agarilytica rhodophyticola TaxID=1737490 RepID=UPI000B3442C9|nr:efflux RND transporter periplasmic adaptor subunit [Agarilytica rhodophyticola]